MRPTGVLRSIFGTLLGGALAGFVAAALVAAVGATGLITGRAAEAPAARTYMVGLLSGDLRALAAVRPNEGVIKQAERSQNTPDTSGWSATGLSFLGGAESGGLGVYIYVAHVRANDGSVEETVPFTVTIAGGKVLRVQ